MADDGNKDPLILAFFDVAPPAITMFPRTTFWEARLPGFRGDPRWTALAHAPPVLAAMRWIGARVLLGRAAHAGTDDVPQRAAEAAEREKECSAALAASLKEFWAAYGEGVPHTGGSVVSSAGRRRGSSASGSLPDSDHGPGSPATLALHFGLNFAASAADYEAGSQPTVLRLLRHVAGIVGAAGLPPAAFITSPLPRTVDDWLWTQLHLDTFTGDLIVDLNCAALNHRPTVFNMPRDMPAMRLRAPAQRTSTLPPPSIREPDAIVPDDLYDVFGGLSWGESYGFIDPDFSPQPTPAELAARLEVLIGNVVAKGYGPLAYMVYSMGYHAAALGDQMDLAGFSSADLALADDLAAGRAGPLGAERAAAVLAQPASAAFRARREHLRRAIRAIWDGMDPRLRAVADAGWDVAALRATFPDSPDPFLLDLMSTLGYMKRAELLLVAPEPFSDLVEGADRRSGAFRRRRRPHPAPPADLSDSEDDASTSAPPAEYDPAIAAWMQSPAFGEACACAFSLAALARTLVASFPLPMIARARIIPSIDRSVVCAAWFAVLVLRRFPASSGPDGARLGQLHAALDSAARACLDVLAAGDRPEVEPVRLLLRDLLEGGRQGITRSEAKMLLVARKTPADCPHGNPGGRCWACASRAAEEGEEGEHELMPGMPGHADVKRGSGARRRVAFSGEDEVGETFASEEYAARSMLAPDEEDDAFAGDVDDGLAAALQLGPAERGSSLTLLLEQWERAGGAGSDWMAFQSAQ